MSKPVLAHSMIIVAGLTLATNVMGFAREIVIGTQFGATAASDAFFTAFNFVSLLSLIFTAGAVQNTFLPRYQALRESGHSKAARYLFWDMLIALTILTLILAGIAALLSKSLTSFLFSGFSSDQVERTAHLIRIMAPIILFSAVGALLQGLLNAHDRFGLPIIVPLLNNIIVIGVVLALASNLGISAVALGFLAGATIWLGLLPIGWLIMQRGTIIDKATPTLSERLSQLELIGRNLLLLVALVAGEQVLALIQKSILSNAEPGAISALHYGSRLAGFPIGIVGMAIATVLFPSLSGALQSGNRQNASQSSELGLLTVAMLLLPAAVFMVIERDIIVRVLFQRGAFDAEASVKSAQVLFWLGWAIVPQALVLFLSRIFFAAERIRLATMIAIACAIGRVAVWIVAIKLFGWIGIAVGTCLYAFAYAGILLYFVQQIVNIDWATLSLSLTRVLVGIVLSTSFLYTPFPEMNNVVELTIKAAGVVLLYFGGLFVMREPALRTLISLR